MANVAKTTLGFLKRDGHDVTIADNVGQTHHATLTRIEESVSVRDDGSFTFGCCKSCNWAGSARRSRQKARSDAIAHLPECPGKGKVRIGVSEDCLIVSGEGHRYPKGAQPATMDYRLSERVSGS